MTMLFLSLLSWTLGSRTAYVTSTRRLFWFLEAWTWTLTSLAFLFFFHCVRTGSGWSASMLPLFVSRVEFARSKRARALIIASGLSDQNKYIQSAKLNGKPYTKNWISQDFLVYGGTLTFAMGSGKTSTWRRARTICR
ncbi:hypothetical protein B0H10DRAFT_547953 [Mycena sp. CBHHK59/15]|nr:hypothetical protein B0H10DRAFT_547953 [Mycena sp. CBHHK59/15]